MLVAYAKSMFGLGWRYEHAVGSRRNLAEAARCYGKAARLGDRSAARRLGQGDAEGSLSSLPPPMPPLAQVWQPDDSVAVPRSS